MTSPSLLLQTADGNTNRRLTPIAFDSSAVHRNLLALNSFPSYKSKNGQTIAANPQIKPINSVTKVRQLSLKRNFSETSPSYLFPNSFPPKQSPASSQVLHQKPATERSIEICGQKSFTQSNSSNIFSNQSKCGNDFFDQSNCESQKQISKSDSIQQFRRKTQSFVTQKQNDPPPRPLSHVTFACDNSKIFCHQEDAECRKKSERKKTTSPYDKQLCYITTCLFFLLILTFSFLIYFIYHAGEGDLISSSFQVCNFSFTHRPPIVENITTKSAPKIVRLKHITSMARVISKLDESAHPCQGKLT